MSEFDKTTWEAEWSEAATPKGPVVTVCVALMAEASSQGRDIVSSRHPEPTGSRLPSSCRLIRGRPKPEAEPYPRHAGKKSPSFDRIASRAQATAIAKKEEKAAIARYRPLVRVAAVRATQPKPRNRSPDHYGLRRHTEDDKGQLSPARGSWPPSYGGV